VHLVKSQKDISQFAILALLLGRLGTPDTGARKPGGHSILTPDVAATAVPIVIYGPPPKPTTITKRNILHTPVRWIPQSQQTGSSLNVETSHQRF
jgi:hypothetical protein